VRWLSRPRAVRISPLGALAAAGIAIAAMFGLRRDAARRGELLATASTRSRPPASTWSRGRGRGARPRHGVRHALRVRRPRRQAGGARGRLQRLEAERHAARAGGAGRRGGVWTVELPLAAGRYSYAFLVDGHRWTPDPAAPRAVGDDFGRPSSVVTVRGA
jgi:hypothetical protein